MSLRTPRGVLPSEFFPSFAQVAESPRLDLGHTGIALTIRPPECQAGQRRWILRGSVCAELTPALEENPEAVLRGLIVVLQEGWSHEVRIRYLVRDELVFAGDVRVEGAHVSAFFNVDLLDAFRFRYSAPHHPYFISVLCGPHRSGVLSCDAPMPWLF